MIPEIGIVIPAYNSETYLRRTVQSVIAQTFTNWELIIVDDGSTDNTSSVVRELERSNSRIHGIRQKNSGQSAARNTGLAAVSPDSSYVIFLDSDDIWDQDALDVLRCTLQTNLSAAAAYALARYIDEQDLPIFPGACEEQCRVRPTFSRGRVSRLPPEDVTSFATLAVANCIISPGVALLRHSAVSAIGNFDTSLKQCEDWDLFIRLSRLGPLIFVDRPIMGYRRHGGNLSGNRAEERAMEANVLRKTISSDENTPEQNAMLRSSYRATQLFYIGEKLDLVRQDLTRGNLRGIVNHLPPIVGRAARFIQGRP